MSKQRATAARKREELLEVVDASRRPLGAMPRSTVHELGLRHKSVVILVYNTENKMYLQRRSLKQVDCPGYWDLSAAGHVKFGEADEEAAYRELKEELNLSRVRLSRIYSVAASQATGYEFVTLFASEPCSTVPQPNSKEVSEGLFVERHELAYLIKTHSAILTPSLVHFWNLGCLFSVRS